MIALSPAAVKLLLDLLDQPEPVLSGAALADFHAASGSELISAGLLVPDGHEAVDNTGEHDDAPVEIMSSDHVEELGYFSPITGWVSVTPARLNRYRVDRKSVIDRLMGPGRRPGRIDDASSSDTIWELGQLRLASKRRRVPAALLRRVSDPFIWKRDRKRLLQNPVGEQSVLVCASPADRLPDDPPRGHIMMSLAEVIDRDGEFTLDAQSIALRFDFTVGAALPNEPLVVLGDGREVRLYGEIFRFPKGDIQRRIINSLYQHYLNGEHEIATAVVVAELDLPDGARVRDYFKHHSPPAMDRLLWEKVGLCGFCLTR